MKWVTWENVGVDRIGCAWLIQRFLDSDAEFIFVPAGQTPLPEGFEPFDIPGVRLSHRRGDCSFHTMLREYDVQDAVLRRIARIIDEADTTQDVSVEPIAAGLDFICQGIRRISPDDYSAIERGRMIYDALYAELSAEGKTS
jgi:hypothetical protein